MKRRRPDRQDLVRLLVVALIVVGLVAAWTLAPYWLVSSIPFFVVGTILSLRRPGNPIGWLLLALIISLILATGRIPTTPAAMADGTAPPAMVALAVLSASVAGPMIFMVLLTLTIVLPGGAMPTGRSGAAARAGLVALGVLALLNAVAPSLIGVYFAGIEDSGKVANPIAVAPDAAIWPPIVAGTSAVLLGLLLAGTSSMVVRAIRSRGIERLQFRWIVSAVAVVIFCAVVSTILNDYFLFGTSIALIPISVGIAVLRYRLYEIDRLVSRTISYALVTLVLAAVFVGVILLFQAVLSPVTNENTIGVAASTLIAAALFQPVRRRIRAAVDRRFDRARYDGERTAAQFATRLRTEVDLATLGLDFVATVEGAVRPTTARLWTRDRAHG